MQQYICSYVLKDIKWHYCVAMVITEGRSLADVVVFGHKMNSILGVTASELHM